MISVLHVVAAKYLLLLAVVGMAAGLFVGLFASLVSEVTIRGLIADACLGMFGSLAGFLTVFFVPWPANTVTYRMNGIVETTTTVRYQHPERVALAVAIVLPLLCELYRFSRATVKSGTKAP